MAVASAGAQGAAGPEAIAWRLPRRARWKVAAAVALVPISYVLLLLLAAACGGAGAGVMYWSYRQLTMRHAGLGIVWVAVAGLWVLLGGLLLLRSVVLSLRKPPRFEPAVWINLNREPDLKRFLEDVCKSVGAEMPSAVILSLLPTFFATEYRFTVLNANAQGRILCIGLPFLPALTVNQLRAVVAHELAHFTGGDVRFSRFVMPAFLALAEGLLRLEVYRRTNSGGASLVARVVLLVPALTLHTCLWVFHLLYASLDRDRERRADAVAAQVCGAESLREALQKTAAYGHAFNEVWPSLLDEANRSNDPDQNCYRLFRKRLKDFRPMAQEGLNFAMETPEERFASHPPLAHRLAHVLPYPERYGDTGPALGLLKELKSYEKLAHGFMINEWRIRERLSRGAR